MRVGEVSQNQQVNKINENVRQNIDENSVQRHVQEQVQEGQNKQKNISKKELKEGVDQLNKTVQAFKKELKFKLHDKSERMMVEVVNLETHEIIKEIPPKEVLDMIGRIRKMVGLLLDENV